MMFKKCIGLVLAFAGFTFLVSIKSAEAQAPCPAETCAVRCHSVGHIYDSVDLLSSQENWHNILCVMFEHNAT